jgi:hypothetical protein
MPYEPGHSTVSIKHLLMMLALPKLAKHGLSERAARAFRERINTGKSWFTHY